MLQTPPDNVDYNHAKINHLKLATVLIGDICVSLIVVSCNFMALGNIIDKY